jgi:hypothetical protein
MNAADRIRAFIAGLRRLSTLGIVLANAVPIVCVILFGWPAGVLLLLYWCENVAIGAVNILKIAGSSLAFGRAGMAVGAFIIPFFTFHYGLFCFVHGVFVMLVGAMGARQVPDFDASPMGLYRVVEGLTRTEPGFLWSLAAIAGWQLLSFVTDWLAKGRFRDTNPMVQMFEPYPRIIVLHLALFAGTVPVVLLGNPMWAIVALAVIKTLFDLGRLGQFRPTDDAVDKSNAAFQELREKLQGRR